VLIRIAQELHTPFFAACWRGHLEIARLLFEHGASVHIVDDKGRSPRVVAQEWNHQHILTFLDTYAPLDPYQQPASSSQINQMVSTDNSMQDSKAPAPLISPAIMLPPQYAAMTVSSGANSMYQSGASPMMLDTSAPQTEPSPTLGPAVPATASQQASSQHSRTFSPTSHSIRESRSSRSHSVSVDLTDAIQDMENRSLQNVS
jgi:Ankyrin repeat